MRGSSSAVSFIAHLGLGAVVVLGTTQAPAKTQRPVTDIIVFPEPNTVPDNPDDGFALPPLPTLPGPIVPNIPVPKFVLQTGARAPAGPVAGSANPAFPGPDGVEPLFSERPPEVLAGPLPRYPDLLRQAGIEGQVVVDAVVDTNGRIEAASLVVVVATNPGFVAPSVDALKATLFRPGLANGRLVRVRVRIPFEFTLRNGTSRAR